MTTPLCSLSPFSIAYIQAISEDADPFQPGEPVQHAIEIDKITPKDLQWKDARKREGLLEKQYDAASKAPFVCLQCCLTIIKTKGRAMRMLAMANEDTLAETRKARLTPARLTRDMVRAKHRKASKAGFSPEEWWIHENSKTGKKRDFKNNQE